ncbi:MAG: tetratricopeptide repeat protein [Clostridia bacterium]|nr:tetratricopeptide repeat protein [Clostridia bacterium]
MGMMSSFKANLAGNKALRMHSSAQQSGQKGDDAKMEAQYKLARQLYEEALEAGCTMPKLYMSYSVLLMRDGEYDRAKELMLKANAFPALADVEKKQLYINYGVCQWKMGNLDKAIEMMRNAEKRGKNATIYIMLGHLLLKQAEQTGDYAEAEAYIQEAYEYDEDDAEGIDLMGQLHLSQGDVEGAKAYFEKALQEKPKQGCSLTFLARIAKQQGDEAAAKQYMERAVHGDFHLMSPISKNEAREFARELGVEAPGKA